MEQTLLHVNWYDKRDSASNKFIWGPGGGGGGGGGALTPHFGTYVLPQSNTWGGRGLRN